MDLTAADMAELIGLPLRSANTVYRKLKRHLAARGEGQSPFRGKSRSTNPPSARIGSRANADGRRGPPQG